MKVVAGGVRGSWPAAQPECMRFGGETTSILVEGAGGERVLLDMGTGARRLGERLAGQGCRDALVLLTHYHLDHVIGLPSFPLLHDGRCRLTFAAPERAGREVGGVLRRLLEDPYWPLQLDGVKARAAFLTLPGPHAAEPFAHGGLEVRWTAVHHHAGCSAFRIDEPATGHSFLLATDVEWQGSTPDERERLLALAREPGPAGLVFFDGHFTPEEYGGHREWGHSTWRDAVEFALAAGVRGLRITHHAPSHDDGVLAGIDAAARAAWDGAAVAVQGEVLDPGAA